MILLKALQNRALYPYDVRPLKRLESLSNPEVRLRHVAMIVGCVTAELAFGYHLLGLWLIIHLIWAGIWQAALRRLPDEVDRFWFFGLIGLVMLDTVIFNVVILLCWLHEEPVMRYMAFVVLYTGMINSVTRRTHDLLMGIADLLAKSIIALSLPLTILIVDPARGEAWSLAIVLSLSLIYFIDAMLRLMSDEMRRRRAERANAERLRLEGLGQLTGGVAHDFNNLLTVIIGNLDLVREMPDGDERDELLNEIGLAAHRGADLTSRLLVYSRKSTLTPSTTEVGPPIDHARKMLRRLLPESIALELVLPQNLPRIEIDLHKFETVIINLVLNARDAMEGRGRIALSARARSLSSRRGPDQPVDLPDGDYVTISVSDTGSGIPEELLARVLEPYFTTKPVGKGSGLGLPMAQGFAVQSGGGLTIRSTEGVGTTVVLWFPAVDESACEMPDTAADRGAADQVQIAAG